MSPTSLSTGAIRRVTNGGIFMAQPRPFFGAPATPPDPPSYEALAVNLRQPLRRDNIRLPLNFPFPSGVLAWPISPRGARERERERAHGLLSGIIWLTPCDYYCEVEPIFI